MLTVFFIDMPLEPAGVFQVIQDIRLFLGALLMDMLYSSSLSDVLFCLFRGILIAIQHIFMLLVLKFGKFLVSCVKIIPKILQIKELFKKWFKK
jgi:hypothetical protein